MAYTAIRSTRDMWENNLPRFPDKAAVIDGDVRSPCEKSQKSVAREHGCGSFAGGQVGFRADFGSLLAGCHDHLRRDGANS